MGTGMSDSKEKDDVQLQTAAAAATMTAENCENKKNSLITQKDGSRHAEQSKKSDNKPLESKKVEDNSNAAASGRDSTEILKLRLESFDNSNVDRWPLLMKEKVEFCCKIVDFADPNQTVDREAKTVALCELIQLINRYSRRDIPSKDAHILTSELLTRSVLRIVSSNLLRPVAPRKNPTGPAYYAEDDDPVFYLDWPHLHLVYDLFIRLLEGTTDVFDAYTARQLIDLRFIHRLLALFDGEDLREREMAKTALHRIYGKMLHLRTAIRRFLRNIFHEFLLADSEDADFGASLTNLYTTSSNSSTVAVVPSTPLPTALFNSATATMQVNQAQEFTTTTLTTSATVPTKVISSQTRHNIGELLEVYASIVNGFTLPLREEHVKMLERTLLPLHKSRHLVLFFNQLSLCIMQYLEKDSNLLALVLKRGLLRFWPQSSSTKELLFINELEEAIESTPSTAHEAVAELIARRLSKCMVSPHFQVAERVLAFWNNEDMLRFATDNALIVYPILLPPLMKANREHWNRNVQLMQFNALQALHDGNPKLYECIATEVAPHLALPILPPPLALFSDSSELHIDDDEDLFTPSQRSISPVSSSSIPQQQQDVLMSDFDDDDRDLPHAVIVSPSLHIDNGAIASASLSSELHASTTESSSSSALWKKSEDAQRRHSLDRMMAGRDASLTSSSTDALVVPSSLTDSKCKQSRSPKRNREDDGTL